MPQTFRAALHLVAAVGCMALAYYPVKAQENPLQDGPTWEELKPLVLADGEIPVEDAGLLALDAPLRAVDPAFVPVHLTQPAGATPLEKLTVIVDENPAPVAAEITLGPAMAPLDMEVRMRVNAYSNVRAIGKASQTSVLAGRFVKAAGGCAAPASKNLEAMQAEMGQMRFQVLASTGEGDTRRKTAKLMIRHPNTTGFQRDQVSLMMIPAHFIDVLEVKQGEDLLFRINAGISISEDPVYQFSFADNGQDTISVHVEDTEGNIFNQSFPLAGL